MKNSIGFPLINYFLSKEVAKNAENSSIWGQKDNICLTAETLIDENTADSYLIRKATKIPLFFSNLINVL